MRIAMIYAQNEQGAIGYKGNLPLPWHFPEDLAHFKTLTRGHHLVMGMDTFESLPGTLPSRTHHVLTRKKHLHWLSRDGQVFIEPSLPEALDSARDMGAETLFIIGGTSVLNEGLAHAEVIYRTLVKSPLEDCALAMGPCLEPDFELVDTLAVKDLVFETWHRRTSDVVNSGTYLEFICGKHR